MIHRGDVALARFPFTDRIGTKIRPVLVLLEVPGPYRDFLVMFIRLDDELFGRLIKRLVRLLQTGRLPRAI